MGELPPFPAACLACDSPLCIPCTMAEVALCVSCTNAQSQRRCVVCKEQFDGSAGDLRHCALCMDAYCSAECADKPHAPCGTCALKTCGKSVASVCEYCNARLCVKHGPRHDVRKCDDLPCKTYKCKGRQCSYRECLRHVCVIPGRPGVTSCNNHWNAVAGEPCYRCKYTYDKTPGGGSGWVRLNRLKVNPSDPFVSRVAVCAYCLDTVREIVVIMMKAGVRELPLVETVIYMVLHQTTWVIKR